MNSYAQNLINLQQKPTHVLKDIGDQWQTPKSLAFGLFWHFTPKIGPIVLDLFASEANKLADNFYTAEINAMTQDWALDLKQYGGAAFANPPYSRPYFDDDNLPITGIEHILEYCRAQREQGAKIMLLLKAATSDGWWPEDADFIQFISGRIGFQVPDWYVPTDPKKDKPSSSGFASAVIIFDKDWQWERRPVERLSRHMLETQGQMIINMIESRAVVIAEEKASQFVPGVIEETTAEPVAGKQIESCELDPAQCEAADTVEESDSVEATASDVPDDNYHLDFKEEQVEPEEDYSDKTLEEIEADTPENEWPRFLCELIAIFGVKEKYTHRERMFAMTSLETNGVQCGTEEQHKLATYIDGCVRTTNNSLPLFKRELITAVAAGFHFITKMNGEKKLFLIVQVMRAAVIGEDSHQPSVDLADTSDVPSLSAEWLREQYMKFDDFSELMDSLKQEAIDKTIDAVGYINEEFASNELAPRAEDVIESFFASNPNVRTYLNSRSLRAAFRSLVQASIKEVANG